MKAQKQIRAEIAKLKRWRTKGGNELMHNRISLRNYYLGVGEINTRIKALRAQLKP